MIVVVSGVQRHGSGKTQLIVGLARELSRMGLRPAASKPVSVTSLWYDHPVLREVLREGVLTDKDTILFSRLSLSEHPSVSNPINVLTAVPDPTRYADIRSYLDDLESPFSLPLLARVSIGGVTKYYRIRDSEDKVPEQEADTVDELLEGLGVNARDVSMAWFYSYLASKEVGAGVAELIRYLSRGVDILLIESISTALLPATTLADLVDALIIAAPGKALLYTSEHIRAYIRGASSANMLDTRQFIRFMKPALSAPTLPAGSGAGITPHRRLVKALASMARG